MSTGSGNELYFSRQNTKGNGNVEYFSTFPLPLKFPKMANKYQLLIGFGRRIPKKEMKNCQTVGFFSTFPHSLKFPKMATKYQFPIGFGRLILERTSLNQFEQIQPHPGSPI